MFKLGDHVEVLVERWEGHTGEVTALAPDAERPVGVKVYSKKVAGKTRAGYELVWFELDEIRTS